MATVFLYVLGASSSADRVNCTVPWKVSDSEIFFGPCKKRLRERLRRQLLDSKTDRAHVKEDIVFAGFNALPPASLVRQVRKVVWAGRVKEAMSFGRAWLDLRGEEYKPMRSHPETPLHLEPLGDTGKPTAYRHFGLQHEERDKWLDDVLTPAARARVEVETKTVRLPPNVSWWDGFPRDICFLLHNLFRSVPESVGRRG
jgi:hypothetical protein